MAHFCFTCDHPQATSVFCSVNRIVCLRICCNCKIVLLGGLSKPVILGEAFAAGAVSVYAQELGFRVHWLLEHIRLLRLLNGIELTAPASLQTHTHSRHNFTQCRARGKQTFEPLETRVLNLWASVPKWVSCQKATIIALHLTTLPLHSWWEMDCGMIPYWLTAGFAGGDLIFTSSYLEKKWPPPTCGSFCAHYSPEVDSGKDADAGLSFVQ